MNERHAPAVDQHIRQIRRRGLVVALAAVALAGSTGFTTQAAGEAPAVTPEQRSYRDFRGSADAMEHWIDAEITRCVQATAPTDASQTADALDRALSHARGRCTASIVAPDRG